MSSNSRLFMSTKAPEKDAQQQSSSDKDKVPITLLSGFLGSGKTSTLQHLLDNTQGLQIGVIVNDMASVNIDAKLVSAAGNSNSGILELQNGCACCSLADELLTTVDSLLESRKASSSAKGGNGKGQRPFDALVVELSGVADPIAIKSNWNAAKTQGHPVTNKAEVKQIVTLVDSTTFGTDWMSFDHAGDRDSWVDPADECAATRKVPELLAEQVEAANVLLINKVDLAGPKQVDVASALARSINAKAIMEEVEYGRVAPSQILRDAAKKPKAAEASTSCCGNPDCASNQKSHSHDHHDHHQDADESSSSISTHDHEHSHSHDDAADTKTDVKNLGITNFVYRASRPFNAKKLLPLLSTWPVPDKNDLDLDLLKEAAGEGYTVEGKEESSSTASPFVGVLRSKGFCWTAPTRWSGPGADAYRHETAMYWSHAGKHFGIEAAGKWWGTISKKQIKSYFQDDPAEYERILAEDFVTDEFGDRRQELVFIGVGLDQEAITKALDDCLVSEKGMKRYRQELNNYMNALLSSEVRGPGLFGVGSVDHMDMQ
ncbi:MAG: hypothetical protein SGARI_000016 [Bacillariaceae sp.]